METKFGGKLQNLHGPVVSNLKAMEKKNTEWDLNDWKWNGDTFTATPLNSAPLDCRSNQLSPAESNVPMKNGATNGLSSGSDEVLLGDDREKRELDKRRKYIEVNEQVNEEAGSLNLKLGGQVFPLMEREVDKWEERSGKKTKVSGAPSSRAVCQVEDCKADLSNAKDYHRRHKVCDGHSKATVALVGNTMQRFCQQCSRFHVLEEFDEGKRSCRRRLAGHNKRRRKTHLENAASPTYLNDEQGSNYLLISLLRILSNIYASNNSDQGKDQDLLSHLLRNLSNLAGSTNERNPAGLLPVSQDLQNVGTSFGTALKESSSLAGPGVTIPLSNLTHKSTLTDNAQGGATHNGSAPQQLPLLSPKNGSNLTKASTSNTRVGRVKVNNIDLNNVYDGSQDCMEDLQDNVAPGNVGNASTVVPLWLCKDSQRLSPPHNSDNLGSPTSQSPSSSSGETQSRTDRIVFKLFGKDPSDFPLVLRKQILDWLSSSPTDIESYIRPGCIILTIYICMDKNAWEELHYNLNCSLKKLLDSSTDSFWRTGWICTRVQHCATFIHNGQVVLDTPLPMKIYQSCRISSISPIAVSSSEAVHFVVKGFNLSRSTSRLLCALEGKYLVQENCADLMRETDSLIEQEEIQSISFFCGIPNIVGRGFVEVEDHGLSSSFFPFIVAEEDVCSEICNLEGVFEVIETANDDSNNIEARNRALEFVHEMGWLLHKNSLMFRLGATNGELDPFPFKRFRWLIEFAIDHDWCAVMKKLLSILFDGTVDAGQLSSILVALMDIGLLHRAVGKKSRSMVNFLLEYRPSEALDKIEPKQKHLDEGRYLFRPDSRGPGALTPLHVAASLDGCEDVIDALTQDPGSVGIEAWKNARESTGLTPNDYACLRGHYSYNHLVDRKLNKKSRKEQSAVDIPANATKLVYFHTEKTTGRGHESQCKQCEQKLLYGRPREYLRLHRSVMLSMVAIAAICVCAALLFKSSPEVACSFRPFRWELLKYGAE